MKNCLIQRGFESIFVAKITLDGQRTSKARKELDRIY